MLYICTWKLGTKKRPWFQKCTCLSHIFKILLRRRLYVCRILSMPSRYAKRIPQLSRWRFSLTHMNPSKMVFLFIPFNSPFVWLIRNLWYWGHYWPFISPNTYRYWYWECLVCIDRLLMTNLNIILRQEPQLRVFLALVLALGNLKLYAQFDPYIDDTDDIFAEVVTAKTIAAFD